MSTQLMQKVYAESKKLLAEVCPNQNSLSDYYKIEAWQGEIDKLFDIMVFALHERSIMKNVVNLQEKERRNEIKQMLFDFDPKKVAVYDEKTLFNDFCRKFPSSNPNNKYKMWNDFAKGVVGIAKKLKETNFDTNKFDKYVKAHSGKELQLIKEFDKIPGIGFAIACNIFKNLGYEQYSKPDTHIIDVFVNSGLVTAKRISGGKNKGKIFVDDKLCEEIFNKVKEMSKAVGESPRTIDITIWLPCSGDFYSDKVKKPEGKSELIRRITANP